MSISAVILLMVVAILAWVYFYIAKPFFEELTILKEDTYKLSLFLSGLIIKHNQLGRKIYNYDLCRMGGSTHYPGVDYLVSY